MMGSPEDDGLEWWEMPESSIRRGEDRKAESLRALQELRKIRGPQARTKQRLINERMVRCEVCHTKGPVILHHIKPLSEGGSWDDDNLILVCRTCHLKAHGYDSN